MILVRTEFSWVATIRNDFLTWESEHACLSLGGKESKQ